VLPWNELPNFIQEIFRLHKIVPPDKAHIMTMAEAMEVKDLNWYEARRYANNVILSIMRERDVS
jgi:hypothetical protein